MSDGYQIAGKRMTDNALYPWSVGSLARALLFYGQAQAHADRRPMGAIATYYSLFHLGMFLIFSCPKHQTDSLKQRIQRGIEGGDDPSPEVNHSAVLDFLKACLQRGLPRVLYEAVVKAQDLRVFINYGPRVYWKGPGNPISVDTCAHRSLELPALQSQLASTFRDTVGWACTEAADGGIYLLYAIREVRGFFAESDPYYADWCTDEETHSAECLRAALEVEVQRRVFGS